MLTISKPNITAITVVVRYNDIVLIPSLDMLLIDLILVTPCINDKKTKGTAMNFSNFIKIVPHGPIQSDTNFSKCKDEAIKPIMIPKIIPINIFAYNGALL